MPAPNAQVIPIQVGGIDAGAENPHVASAALTRIENGHVSQKGLIEKRHGLALLAAESNPMLAEYRGQVVAFGDKLKIHDGDAPSTGTLREVADLGLLDIDTEHLSMRRDEWAIYPGAVVTAHYTVISYGDEASGEWVVAVYSRHTGELAARRSFADADATRPGKVIALGTQVFYAYPSNDPTPLFRIGEVNVGLGTAAVPAATTLAGAGTPSVADVSLDGCADQAGTRIMWTFITSALDVQFAMTDSAGALQAGGSIATTALECSVNTWLGAANQALVVYRDDDGVGFYRLRAAVFDTAGSVQRGPVTIESWATGGEHISTLACVGDPSDPIGTSRVYWTREATAGPYLRYAQLQDIVGTLTVLTAAATLLRRHRLVVKPVFDDAGRSLLVLHHDAGRPQVNAYAYRHDGGTVTAAATLTPPSMQIVGKSLIGYSYSLGTDSHVSEMTSLGADQYACAVGRDISEEAGVLGGVSSLVHGGVSLLILDRDPSLQAIEAEEQLLLEGSAPMVYDGSDLVEMGWLQYPPQPTVADSGAGAWGVAGAGTYTWINTYLWIDRQGRKHRSAPSPASATYSQGAGGTLPQITMGYLPHTRRPGTVYLELWRREAADTVYTIVDRVVNDETADTTTYDDDGFNVSSNPQLYTTGGVLENIQPPGTRAQAIYQGRHFVVDREREDRLIRYSKPFVDGLSVEHNDVLSISVDAAGGRITALAEMGDRLVIFKTARIYVTQGTGLNNLGQRTKGASGYVDPILVSEAVGCTNARTVVRTQRGLMFLSERGIYLLDRSFNVAPIGQRVRYHTDRLSIQAGALIADRDLAIWVSTDGTALVYSTLYDQWSTYRNHAARSVVYAEGVYWIADGASLFYENRGVYTESGHPEAGDLDGHVIAEYRLDEDSGDAVDSSGNGHDLSASTSPAPLSATGKFGGARRWNGNITYLRTLNNSAFDLPQFTWEGWYFPESAAPGAGHHIAKNNGTGTSVLYLQTPSVSSGRAGIELNVVANDGLSGFSLFSADAHLSEAWHHLGVTYDGAVFRLYIDGVLVDSGALDASLFDWNYLTSQPGFQLWGYVDITTVDGPDLDHWRVHDVARDPSWIAERAGVEIVMKIETSEVHLAKLLGYARLHKMLVRGYLRSACKVRVQWQYAGDPYWQDETEIDSALLSDLAFDWTALFGEGLSSSYEDKALTLAAVPGRLKLGSFRLRIFDSDLGGTKEGFSLSALAAHADAIPGPYPVGDARHGV